MLTASNWPWLALILLGAWHGLNPGMGWLFSVALGLQQRSRTAVFQALLPIALGHAVAIALVAVLLLVLNATIPFTWLQFGGAILLFAIACVKIWRGKHPTWVGMRVNFWDLTNWSLIMATAHGAGLMVVPVFIGLKSSFCGGNFGIPYLSFDPLILFAIVSIHTVSHLLVSGLLAWIVYDFVGLAILRRSWINLDLIWAFSLVAAAVVVVLLPRG
jgi:hypothetical protein